MFGYSLYRKYNYQKMFMLVGSGANGKSTLLNILHSMLGSDNVSNVSIDEIASGHRFVAWRLYNKMANISIEIDSSIMRKTKILKMATGGDEMTGERKNQDQFEFYNVAKLIFSVNEVPKVYDTSDAFYRRWIPINFNREFYGRDRNPDLLEEITTNEESMSAVLNWSLEGLQRLLTQQRFTGEWTHEQVRDWWNNETNSFYHWVHKNYRLLRPDEERNPISKQDVYEHYKSDTDKFGYITYDTFCRKFIEAFRLKGYELKETRKTPNSPRMWIDITETSEYYKGKYSE